MMPKNPKPAPLTIRLSTKVILREARDVPETRLEDLIGCTGYRGPAKTLKEMEAGIALGARQRRNP